MGSTRLSRYAVDVFHRNRLLSMGYWREKMKNWLKKTDNPNGIKQTRFIENHMKFRKKEYLCTKCSGKIKKYAIVTETSLDGYWQLQEYAHCIGDCVE